MTHHLHGADHHPGPARYRAQNRPIHAAEDIWLIPTAAQFSTPIVPQSEDACLLEYLRSDYLLYKYLVIEVAGAFTDRAPHAVHLLIKLSTSADGNAAQRKVRLHGSNILSRGSQALHMPLGMRQAEHLCTQPDAISGWPCLAPLHADDLDLRSISADCSDFFADSAAR